MTIGPMIPSSPNLVPQSVPSEHLDLDLQCLYISQFNRQSSKFNPLTYDWCSRRFFSRPRDRPDTSTPLDRPKSLNPPPFNDTLSGGTLYFHKVPDTNSNPWKDIMSDFHSLYTAPIYHPDDASVHPSQKHHLIRHPDFTPNWVQHSMWKSYKKGKANATSPSAVTEV